MMNHPIFHHTVTVITHPNTTATMKDKMIIGIMMNIGILQTTIEYKEKQIWKTVIVK